VSDKGLDDFAAWDDDTQKQWKRFMKGSRSQEVRHDARGNLERQEQHQTESTCIQTTVTADLDTKQRYQHVAAASTCTVLVQIDEEQWWDIDREELPPDRQVYQDFN